MVFDAIIADMLGNKKRNAIVTELFIRGRKLNISVFYYTFLFCCSKKYQTEFNNFVMEIPNKRELNKWHLIIHQILTFKTL